MKMRVLALAAALVSALILARPAFAQVEQQRVVTSAQTTLERMKNDANFQKDFQPRLSKAKGVLIIPSLFKGGFILGAQYGNGVLLARHADGSWSYPAFYTIAGGSIGLQIGAADNSILFMINSDKGLNAVLDSQFKFGADAGITFVVVGAGVGAATTANLDADIVAFALGGVGLYGGLSLEGTSVSPRESWNAAYYQGNVATRTIIQENRAGNRGADALREILAR